MQTNLFDSSYYNTTGLYGSDLVKEQINAQDQEGRILRLFKHSDEAYLSPSEVMKKYELIWNAIPITSIRRALTNLTKGGKLVKTSVMKTGMYNKPERCWQLIK